jgi:hypothetical protein
MPGKRPELLDCGVDVVAHLGEQRSCRLRVGGEELLCKPKVHAQSDEVLLGAVVEVALDAQPLGVGRRDDPRP